VTEVNAWIRVWSKDDKLERALFRPKICAGVVRQGSIVRHAQLESQASRSVTSQLTAQSTGISNVNRGGLLLTNYLSCRGCPPRDHPKRLSYQIAKT